MKPKFASMRNEAVNINLNGLELCTTADQIDVLFGDGDPIVRYCINAVFFMLDQLRQDSFEHGMPPNDSVTNTATLPSGVKLTIQVYLKDSKFKPYMKKGAEGSSWAIHSRTDIDPQKNYPKY
jgi:hypothetical protein